MSASTDFGIPVAFGMAQSCFDEKKSVPLRPKLTPFPAYSVQIESDRIV